MKKLLILLLFASALFAQIAKFSLVVGDVEIHRGSMVLKAKTSDEIQNKDIIQTKNGKAQIIFSDSTIVTLGKNTDLNIKDYIKSSKENKADLFVGKGVFKVITGEIGKIAPKRFKLKTKTSTIGIRGTVFIGEIDSNLEKIACLDGAITAKIGSKTYEIPKGQMIDHDILAGKIVQENIDANSFSDIKDQIVVTKPKTSLSTKTQDNYTNKYQAPFVPKDSDIRNTIYLGALSGKWDMLAASSPQSLDPTKSMIMFMLDYNGYTDKYKQKNIYVLACQSEFNCNFYKNNDHLDATTNLSHTMDFATTNNSAKIKNSKLTFSKNEKLGIFIDAQINQQATARLNNPHFAFKDLGKEFYKPKERNLVNITNAQYKGLYKGVDINSKYEESSVIITINTTEIRFNLHDSSTIFAIPFDNIFDSGSSISDKYKFEYFGKNDEYLLGAIETNNHKGFVNAKKQ